MLTLHESNKKFSLIKKGIWHLKLKLKAGRGGDGIISWDRNRYNSRMGPAGGDGGNGASIIFQTDSKFSDFAHIKAQKLKALNGSNGQKSSKQGKSANNLIIKVPRNIEIYDLNKKMRLAHLKENGNSFLICKGGRGGRGNKSFRQSQLQSPWLYELGEQGEKKEILLKLSSSSLIALINFLEANIFDTTVLLKNQIDLLQISIPELKECPESINFCKASVILINKDHPNYLNYLTIIENFLQKFQKLKVLMICVSSKNSLNYEEKILSRYGDIWSLQEKEINLESLTKKLISFVNSLKSYLPLLTPQSSEDSEYIEYSDELFRHKEELKIIKTEDGWEINSQSIDYWGSRIPQTTIHNIERLKLKLKIEDVIKQLKKIGGIKGEKIKIGVFETEIY